jgi:uncharacterized protein (TIGR03382 family)
MRSLASKLVIAAAASAIVAGSLVASPEAAQDAARGELADRQTDIRLTSLTPATPIASPVDPKPEGVTAVALQMIPTPGAAGLMALGGLALLRRRREK